MWDIIIYNHYVYACMPSHAYDHDNCFCWPGPSPFHANTCTCAIDKNLLQSVLKLTTSPKTLARWNAGLIKHFGNTTAAFISDNDTSAGWLNSSGDVRHEWITRSGNAFDLVSCSAKLLWLDLATQASSASKVHMLSKEINLQLADFPTC